MDNPAGTS